MKKRIGMFLAAAMAAVCAQADTWTDPDTGITWSYQVNGDEAEICKIVYDYYQVAVSPAPTGHVTIPSTLGGKPVTCIGANAFYDCREFTSVLIPDSVTSIGGWAFRDCRGLASVKIPNSVTNIGDAAFYECTSLTSVTIGSGVTNIGGSAFNYCSRLVDVTIPDSVTSIGYGAFSETPFYDSQPNGLVVFGRVAYKMKGNCPRSVVIPDGVASIGDDAFYGCYGLASVAMPDSLTSIGDFAFFGCENLTDVTIPDSVTRIGECAFECSGLMSVTIGKGVESVGDAAFWGCNELTSVSLPDSLTSIGDSVFALCRGLKSVSLGKGVTSIGSCAFQECRSLTSVTIPDSMTSIGDDAFSGCNEALFDTATIHGVTLLDGWAVGTTDSLSGDLNLTGVRGIGNSAFSGCSGLTTVTIPQCVCSSRLMTIFPAAYQTIDTVVISDDVTHIGDYAFSGCSGLWDLFFRGNAPVVGNYSFDQVNPSCTVYVREESTGWGVDIPGMWNGLPIEYIKVETAKIDFRAGGGAGSMDTVYMDVDGYTRWTLPVCRFSRSGYSFVGWRVDDPCSFLEVQFFLAGVSYELCGGDYTLTAMWSQDGNPALSIEDGVLLLVYPNGHSSVSIPDGVTSIGDGAFYGCGGLTSVTIPGSVTSIDDGAFYGCNKLTRIMVDASNPYFSSANGLLLSKDGKKLILGVNGDVVIPDGVTSIGNYAFYNCSGLASVTIPESVKDIGTGAFSGCGNLKSVMLDGDAPNIGSWAFEDVGDGCTMYVRKGSTGWGVDIPGTWDGVRIEYFDGLTEKCTITFDVNGSGALRDEEATRMVVKNTAVGELPTPMVPNLAYSGFGRFQGWFTAKTEGAQISADTIVTKDVTYYAHWKYFRYIVLDANGGEFSEGYNDWWPFAEDGATIGTLPAASRSGYTFDGWYTAASGGAKVSSDTRITATVSNIREPLKYYAHWTAVVAFPDVTTWKFYEEADDDEGLNLAAWEEWDETDVAFWIGEGINMAIPVDGNLSASDIVLVAGTYSGYGTPQVVSDEWMFAKHCTALEQAIGYDPYEDYEYDQGAYGLVFEEDVKGRNYSLSMDIWPDKKIVPGRQWILLEIGGDPTKGCKTFYLGVKGRDDVGYSRFRIYATPDQGVSQSPSNWSSQRELAVLPMPIGGGTTSGSGMYANGTQVSLSANPNAGYEFDGWYDQSNGQLLGTSASFSYAMEAANKTIFAKFRQRAKLPDYEPREVSELFDNVDGIAPVATASVYDGYLYSRTTGALMGTIRVKVGKPNAKTGLAAVSAVVVGFDGKKIRLKASDKGKAQIASDGPTTVSLEGGETCTVVLGADGMGGTYGAYEIDGARNVFTSRDSADKAAAAAVLDKWKGTVNVAWRRVEDSAPYQTLSVTIANKGKVKVAGTLADGTKVSASGQLSVGEVWCCVPVVVSKKTQMAFAVWLRRVGDNAPYRVVGLGEDVKVGKPGALKGGAAFRIDADAFAARWGQRALPYLPDGVAVGGGAKWTLPKAGSVAYAKGTTTVDEAKAGENPSGLKLTYKAKDGTFKGSFKAYADVGGKPKATKVDVTGVLVDGVGYGAATVKKVGGVAVTVE